MNRCNNYLLIKKKDTFSTKPIVAWIFILLFTVFIVISTNLIVQYQPMKFDITSSDHTPVIGKTEQNEFDDNEDQVSNSRNSVRKSVRGSFATWGMWDPELIDMDDPNGKTIYAGYKPYTLQFMVDDMDAFENVSAVKIDIVDELFGTCEWNRTASRMYGHNTTTNSRSTTTRTYGTAGFYKISPDFGYLDFNITFGWAGPDTQGKHSWKVTVIQNETFNLSVTFEFEYNVVRSLQFTGTLDVDGEVNEDLQENDWVRSNENITWSGLKVKYSGSPIIVPPLDQCRIILSDDHGNTWTDSAEYGKYIQITSQTGDHTDVNPNYVFDITGLAMLNLIETIPFVLSVDGDGVYFYDVSPTPGQWQTTQLVKCSIIVADNLTSGVDQDSVEFNFSTNGGKAWQGWYKPKIVQNGSIVEYYKEINFPDGDSSQNLIRWRGQDNVRNKYTLSKKYSVPVDTTKLMFKNPQPPVDELQYSSLITCSIELSDVTSGVDGGTIQYSTLFSGFINWSSWKSLPVTVNKTTIKSAVQIDFNYGEYNYIKWRAKDVAGNGYYESTPYQLRITHETPDVTLIYPNPSSIINEITPLFEWIDTYVLLQPVTYTFEYWTDPGTDDDNDGVPDNRASKKTIKNNYTIEVPLEYGTKYYWRIVSEAQNKYGDSIFESPIRNFTVNTFEQIHPMYRFDAALRSKDKIEIKPTQSKTIEFIIFNKGNRDDTYILELFMNATWEGHIEINKNITVNANSESTQEITIIVPESIEFKKYSIKVKITSLGAIGLNQTPAVDTIQLDIEIIKEQKSTAFKLEDMIWYITAIVVIIGVIMIVFVVRAKLKIKRFQESFVKPSRLVKGVEVEYQPEHSKAIDMRMKGKENIPRRPT